MAFLRPYMASGAVGLTRLGLLSVRDISLVPVAERHKLHRVVREENSARRSLYWHAARSNGHAEWSLPFALVFARAWQSALPPGSWHQDPDGKWHQTPIPRT